MVVLENVQRIAALELLVAAQALDLRLAGLAGDGPAIRAGAGVAEAHARIRSVVPHLDRDRLQTTDIEAAFKLVCDGSLVDLTVEAG
jgi:histidine ammonia-lyase